MVRWMLNRFFGLLYLFFIIPQCVGQTKIKIGSHQDVLDSYLELCNALADSNLKNGLSYSQITQNEIVKNRLQNQFTAYLIACTTANSISELRKSVLVISKLFRQVLPFSESLEEEIFVVYSLKAFQGDGAMWLTNNKKLRNPYYRNSKDDSCKIGETIRPMVK